MLDSLTWRTNASDEFPKKLSNKHAWLTNRHLWVFCTHECWHFCLLFAFGKGEGTVIDYPDISVAFWQEISDDGFCSLAWWHTSCLMSSIKWCWEVTVCLNPPGNQREPVAPFAVATLGLRVCPGCFFCLFPLAWICPWTLRYPKVTACFDQNLLHGGNKVRIDHFFFSSWSDGTCLITNALCLMSFSKSHTHFI